MKTAARDLSSSCRAWSTPDLVMTRLLDCGMKRKEREESSSRKVETERLVRRDQRPPGIRLLTLTLTVMILPRRNQRGREARAAVTIWSGLMGMLVERSSTEGRGGNPRGGRLTVLTGAGLVLTDGWKSLITS